LVVEGFLNKAEVQLLQRWSQEVHDLPRTPEVPWMPYEVRYLESTLVRSRGAGTDIMAGGECVWTESPLSHGKLRQQPCGIW
jgi:hypothetical protein